MPSYAHNASGQTYGTAPDVDSDLEPDLEPDQEPDLIATIADDGKTVGYTRKADLDGVQPTSIEPLSS